MVQPVHGRRRFLLAGEGMLIITTLLMITNMTAATAIMMIIISMIKDHAHGDHDPTPSNHE